MKKYFVVFMVSVMMAMVVLPMLAAASDAAVEVGLVEGVDENTFTWPQLATVAGATLATVFLVQFIKLPLDKVWKIPTRLVVYVIALVILVLANAFTVGITAEGILLLAGKALIVASSAMGAYEVLLAKREAKLNKPE